MILFKSDIERIAGLGYRVEDFAAEVGGYVRLKNVEGRCYFLGSDGRCKIYSYRPIGCRVYPLIIGEDDEPALDPECPLTQLGEFTCQEISEGLEILEQIVELLEVEYNTKISRHKFVRGSTKLLNKFCRTG